MSAQTLGFAVQPEDRPVLDELVAYFGDGNRSAYLRATLKVMKSIMIADLLVSETPWDAGDGADVRRSAHNPEVAGSNPAPATKSAGQRPLPIMEGAFCGCRVHGIAHEASEEGRRADWR